MSRGFWKALKDCFDFSGLDPEDVYDAIRDLNLRGIPASGFATRRLVEQRRNRLFGFGTFYKATDKLQDQGRVTSLSFPRGPGQPDQILYQATTTFPAEWERAKHG